MKIEVKESSRALFFLRLKGLELPSIDLIMNTLKQYLGFAFLLLLSITSLQAQSDEAQIRLKQTIDGVLDMLYEGREWKDFHEKNDAILAKIESTLSLDIILRRALGRNWRKLTVEEQNQFKNLFGKLLANSYTSNLEQVARPEFVYEKTVELKKGLFEVKTHVYDAGEKFHVDYRLVIQNGDWSLYDISVEGVSLLTNYRKQFDSILNRKSFDELIQLLNDKLNSITM